MQFTQENSVVIEQFHSMQKIYGIFSFHDYFNFLKRNIKKVHIPVPSTKE